MIRIVYPRLRATLALSTTLAVILGMSLINPVGAHAFDGGASAPSFGDGHGRGWERHDRDRRGRDQWRHRQANAERHHHRYGSRPSQGGGDGLPSILPGIGTYSGGIAALRVKGHGIYFSVDPLATASIVRPLAPVAKVVHVSREDACSYEAGVCVIRPQP